MRNILCFGLNFQTTKKDKTKISKVRKINKCYVFHYTISVQTFKIISVL